MKRRRGEMITGPGGVSNLDGCHEPLSAEQEKKEQLSELAVYSYILINMDSPDLDQYIFENKQALCSLLQRVTAEKPNIKSKTFRSYGDEENERRIEAWENSQDKRFTGVVTRPDGKRGIYINYFREHSSNWYSVPKDITEEEAREIEQLVIANELLASIIFVGHKPDLVDIIGGEWLKKHQAWVQQRIGSM